MRLNALVLAERLKQQWGEVDSTSMTDSRPKAAKTWSTGSIFVAGAFAVLVVAGCGSSNGGALSAEQKQNTTRGSVAATSAATLSPSHCSILLQQLKAGTKTLAVQDYEKQCGALHPTTATTVFVPSPPPPMPGTEQICPHGWYRASSGTYVCSP